MDAFDAVVDKAVRPGLLPVTPHLDLIDLLGERDLTADGRRRFLPPAVVRPKRSEDVVEADDKGLEAIVLEVVPALALGEQLLPPVSVLGVGRIGILFLERGNVR